jgi:hypothetical protein
VRQRLLSQSRAQNRPFQQLLQYYAKERFLYRRAQSGHADKFVLKGALLLTVWRAPISRQAVDIDLLGNGQAAQPLQQNGSQLEFSSYLDTFTL